MIYVVYNIAGNIVNQIIKKTEKRCFLSECVIPDPIGDLRQSRTRLCLAYSILSLRNECVLADAVEAHTPRTSGKHIILTVCA